MESLPHMANPERVVSKKKQANRFGTIAFSLE
jgi:hypothetical protein